MYNINISNKEEAKRKRLYTFFIDNWSRYMTILVDQNEKNLYIYNEMKERRLPVEKKILSLADYGFYLNDLQYINNDSIGLAIERKHNIDEIIGNFWDRDTMDQNKDNRFSRNLKKSIANGYKYIFLCENGNWEDLYNARYKSDTNVNSIKGKILSLTPNFDIRLEFIPSSIMCMYIVDTIIYYLRGIFIYGDDKLSQSFRDYVQDKKIENYKINRGN